jgi:curli biogenesis system outer membrane secretion channel CsgG
MDCRTPICNAVLVKSKETRMNSNLRKLAEMKHIFARTSCLAIVIGLFALSGCDTAMKIGDQGAKTVATGSAGGSTASNANTQLEHCDKTIGTLTIVEDQTAHWYYELQQYKLHSTIPLIRMLVQQSNCFVVVERGRALYNVQQERELERSGELREGSKFGKGQMVSADYTMNPTVSFSQSDAGGVRGALASFGNLFGSVAGAVAGGVKTREASTMLTLTDNRSGVQLASAEGSSSKTDLNLLGGLFGGGNAAGLGGYTNTAEGKVLTAAFVDSYNQLVQAVRNYKAQEVEGGMGKGGHLSVGH